MRALGWSFGWRVALGLAVAGCGDDATASAGSDPSPIGSTGDATPMGTTTTGLTLSFADTAHDEHDEHDSTRNDGSAATTAITIGESSSSGADGSTESTGSTVPPVVELQFTEIASEVGLVYDHGAFNQSPDCVVDQVGPGTGGFCISERMTGAVAVSDYDDDGDLDVWAARIHGPDLLFRNAGDGTFVDVAATAGLVPKGPSSGALWADFDNDGDQDLYVTTLGYARYHLWIGDGDGHFTEEAIERGAAIASEYAHSPMGVAAGDYDLDGWLDLYVAEWKTNAGLGSQPSHSRLLHNLGSGAPGHFEDVTDVAGVNIDHVWAEFDTQPGTYAFAPAFADLDGDRFPELVVVSDFRCSRLFWNDTDGTFTDGTVAAGVGLDRNGMGSTFGDFDLDGDLDWFVTAITSPGEPPANRLFRYDGDRVFSEQAAAVGVAEGGWGWGAVFFDPDNDGDPDLFMASGYYYTDFLGDSNRLWENHGDGSFSADQAPAAGVAEPGAQARGVVAFDHDGDGDEDLLVVNNLAYPSLFRNDTGQAHDWLRVHAVGTTSNRDAVGAQVRVQLTEGAPVVLQEIGTTSHLVGQSPRDAHFGLGFGAEPVAEVRVYWPASDVEQVFVDVPRNVVLEVVEP